MGVYSPAPRTPRGPWNIRIRFLSWSNSFLLEVKKNYGDVYLCDVCPVRPPGLQAPREQPVLHDRKVLHLYGQDSGVRDVQEVLWNPVSHQEVRRDNHGVLHGRRRARVRQAEEGRRRRQEGHRFRDWERLHQRVEGCPGLQGHGF
ncbi:Orf56R [Frog virus 3]|uniref:Uncharacterized protein 056R n=4 Tax=Ranavirus rana1 TaxID=3391521 RepID=056R_FRG3G|nr:hypothetical protein FV3gorf56R [Frog virus 3]Q6GZR9.1 RecName: Full=Uncharacterized protein 056R [Frog virus 3 (isolate Goorha)]ASU44204.1 hypothetical protein RCV-Z2_ORF76 [Rana catesbeiana virus 2]AWU46815.1 hypothetical protein [Terrapene carolina carolina ranavirus]AWU46910.1 hypothetical protein [Trioceros melleri ranavirus]AAT09716.1 unknown [Frog virus 3]AHM26134.1 hypothetical protein SSMEgorf56R [Frog virus 3]